MKVEIHILADGNVQMGRVIGEAGFAALVKVRYDDSSEFQFLFDTAGGTPTLEHNVGVLKDRLDQDLSSIEMMVLSHGHWDHVAGVLKVISMVGKSLPVLCHPDALLHKIFTSDDGKRHEAGIHRFYNESELESKVEVIATREPYKVADGIMTTGVVPRINDYEKLTGNLQKIVTVRNGKETPDLIEDDLSVIFHMKDDSVVILTGCCHSGIMNTVEHAINQTGSSSVIGIVGGLHLHDASKVRLEKTTERLDKLPLQNLAACHCTGLRGKAAMMMAFDDKFKNAGAGSTLKFESV
jgi:7,8-dihydropterin-6-yl-methyl-4-(beta-D-ribofuranosyl)aminobenzene 5'-phosphate synthase